MNIVEAKLGEASTGDNEVKLTARVLSSLYIAG